MKNFNYSKKDMLVDGLCMLAVGIFMDNIGIDNTFHQFIGLCIGLITLQIVRNYWRGNE